MVNPRVIETGKGITGEDITRLYDAFQRHMRDKGLIGTKEIIKAGIDSGRVLEIGPGPGYLGLEWLKSTVGTQLVGLEISADMVVLAERNKREYELEDRAEYVLGDGCRMPLEDRAFDAAFTNGSLHEWEDPVETFDEIGRVLKPGGLFFISDLKRNVSFPVKWLMWFMSKPKQIRPGFLTSVAAAYTRDEVRGLLDASGLAPGQVRTNPFGLTISGAMPV